MLPYIEAAEASQLVSLRLEEAGDALDAFALARRPLPLRGGPATESRVEPTLTRAAIEVADGRHVEVRCWAADDWRHVLKEESALTDGGLTIDSVGAFAVRGTGALHLQQAECADLGRLAYDGWSPTSDGDRDRLAYVVSVLSHEIQHIVNPAGEAETECAAVQHNADVAEALGASRAQALELADRYWEELYPPDDEEYQSDACRPGGALDLAPATPAWPSG